jgi:hypothetical protein
MAAIANKRMEFRQWMDRIQEKYSGEVSSHPELFTWWAANYSWQAALARLKTNKRAGEITDTRKAISILPTLEFSRDALADVLQEKRANQIKRTQRNPLQRIRHDENMLVLAKIVMWGIKARAGDREAIQLRDAVLQALK